VVRAARRRPEVLFVGVDADPTRMRRASGHAPANAILVVAVAENLPAEPDATVSELTAHFPWGSLLHGLVAPSPTVLDSAGRVLRPGARLTGLLSITARDGGKALGAGSIDRAAYDGHGLEVLEWRRATPAEIVASDSSWAKRLRASEAREVWRLRARRSGCG
jgi:16S rRNA (adenine(1408)-N(1))-methyltransferase